MHREKNYRNWFNDNPWYINSDPKTIFSEMHQINEKLIMDYSYKGELSMGMSNDYEVALDYGATIVRIGTKLFI